MQIECKIKRAGGSDIQIAGKTYEFRPDELDRHVCDVQDKKAIQRLLSIPEGYRIVGDDDDSIDNYPDQVKADPAGNTLNPGDPLSDDIVLDDEEVETFNEDDEPDPDAEEANDLAPTDETSTGDTQDGDEDLIDPEAVKTEWEMVFGKKAGRRTTETMLKDLREAEQE